MDTLKDIISDIRIFLYGGMVTLPVTLAGTLIILGLFTANYAILFFLLGFLVLTPLVSFLLSLFFDFIAEKFGWTLFKAKTTDICKINVPYTTWKNPVGIQEQNTSFSAWTAMVAFFIGYIFTNGVKLYGRESPDTSITVTTDDGSDISNKVEKRKTQAIIAMGSIILFAILALGYRYFSGCESLWGMIFTILIFGFGGRGWYEALSSIGEDRLSDVFGIANRLLAPSAITNAPIACMPIQA